MCTTPSRHLDSKCYLDYFHFLSYLFVRHNVNQAAACLQVPNADAMIRAYVCLISITEREELMNINLWASVTRLPEPDLTLSNESSE